MTLLGKNGNSAVIGRANKNVAVAVVRLQHNKKRITEIGAASHAPLVQVKRIHKRRVTSDKNPSVRSWERRVRVTQNERHTGSTDNR